MRLVLIRFYAVLLSKKSLHKSVTLTPSFASANCGPAFLFGTKISPFYALFWVGSTTLTKASF